MQKTGVAKGADFLDAFLTSVGHGGTSAAPLLTPEEAAVHGDAGTNLLSGNRLYGLPDDRVGDETLMVSVNATVTGGSGIDRFEGDTGAGLSGSAFPEIGSPFSKVASTACWLPD